MRAAAAILVLAGCADATGIVLTATPGDSHVTGADRLEVFVGRGDMVETRPGGEVVHLHQDDGFVKRYAIGAFADPVDVLLDADGDTAPFFITVRAYEQDAVVGEGGFPGTLQIVDGKAEHATIEVTRIDGGGDGTTEFQPNCPGLDGGDHTRHYILGDPAHHDCDADGADQDGGDCDDYDASLGIDSHTTCVIGDPATGPCLLGTQACGGACSPGGVSLDPAACTCRGQVGGGLRDCLAQFALPAQCTVAHTDGAMCSTFNSPGFDPHVWWSSAGTATEMGLAAWLDVGMRDPNLDFGFVDPPMMVQPGATALWPPSPAILWGGALLADPLDRSRLLATRNPQGVHQLYDVTFQFVRVADCVPDTAAACVGLPSAN